MSGRLLKILPGLSWRGLSTPLLGLPSWMLMALAGVSLTYLSFSTIALSYVRLSLPKHQQLGLNSNSSINQSLNMRIRNPVTCYRSVSTFAGKQPQRSIQSKSLLLNQDEVCGLFITLSERNPS